MTIGSNASQIAKRYRRRAGGLDKAVRRGLRKYAIAVDREQVKNLSGSGAPGSYPVPVRKGTLRGGHFFEVSRRFAVVGNTTEYAPAVHGGELATNEGLRFAVKGRPFLDDAAEAVDGTAMLAGEVKKAMAVR